jgi:hypothetical protein
MNPQTIVFMLFIAFLLGAAIGDYFGRRAKEKKKAQTDHDPELGDLFCLRENRKTGQLQVELDGQTFLASEKLNKQQSGKIGEVMQALSAWMNQPPPAAPSPQPGPTIPNEPNPPSAAILSGPGLDSGQPILPEGKTQPKRISWLSMLIRAVQTDVSTSAFLPKSLAVQVDEILQEKLKGTPLATRGIKLMETEDQGVAVMVGLDRYENVAAVPDEEIRTVIQSAVNEWLKRSAK